MYWDILCRRIICKILLCLTDTYDVLRPYCLQPLCSPWGRLTDTYDVLRQHTLQSNNIKKVEFNRYIWSIETSVGKTKFLEVIGLTDTYDVLRPCNCKQRAYSVARLTDTYDVLRQTWFILFS